MLKVWKDQDVVLGVLLGGRMTTPESIARNVAECTTCQYWDVENKFCLADERLCTELQYSTKAARLAWAAGRKEAFKEACDAWHAPINVVRNYRMWIEQMAEEKAGE